MPTFVERVQALPVELYDEVFALTFTPDLIITVDDSYKPPTTLQVSRATRMYPVKRWLAISSEFP